MRACLGLLLLGPLVARADESFEKQVRPLLLQHCVSCHGAEKQKAGLRLDTKPGWQAGGGVSYSLGAVDVFASFSKYIWGRNAHNGQAYTAGASWYFDFSQ